LRRLSLVVSVLLCAGCLHQQNRSLGWYAAAVDLSDADGNVEAATVTGRAGSIVLWSWDCWMDYPARAKRLILKPGPVTLRVACEVAGVTDSLFVASLTFDAAPGGTYDAGSSLSRCIVVRDVVSGNVVAGSACRAQR